MIPRVSRLFVALAAVVVLAGGCQALTGRTAGRWVDDHAVTAKVKARLGAVKATNLTRIGVDTYGGTVYLSGVVDTEEMRERAEATARGVDGVQQVVTNLQVRNRTGRGSASPITDPRVTSPAPGPAEHVRGRLRAIAPIDADSLAQRTGPFRALDRAGRVVATIYTVSMRELATSGLAYATAEGERIDYVSIYPVSGDVDVPDPHYHVVLWHVPVRDGATPR